MTPKSKPYVHRASNVCNDRPEGHRAGQSRGALHRLSQACDYCRLRKIKCDLRRPSCANCENRSIVCKFSFQSRKRGPKAGSRGVDEEGQARAALSPPIRRTTYSSAQLSGLHWRNDANGSTGRVSSGSTSSDFTDSSYTTQHASVLATEISQDPPHLPNNSQHETAHYASFSVVPERSPLESIYSGLEVALGALQIDLSIPSLARRCVDHFFDCLYPIMPIVYRPKIELGLCLLQPGIERRDVDIQIFTLTTSLCAIAATIIPSTILQQDSRIADSFYHASKRGLDLYRTNDLEHPTSTSIAIRYFHSGYIHAAGKRQRSWDDLEDAIRLVQVMRLHDETSYCDMDYIESQLCRRLFWILFTADKSAAILNNHPITLGRDFFEGVITAQYSKDLEDQPLSPSQDLDESVPSIITGFNFNQDLWRAAYSVLAEIDFLRNRPINLELGEEQASKIPGLEDYSRLMELYLIFETSLDNLPRYLRASPTLSLSPSAFRFGQNTIDQPLPRALAVQRTNLHVSFQCLRLVIVQAMSKFMNFSSTSWHSFLSVSPLCCFPNINHHLESPDQYLQPAQVSQLDHVTVSGATETRACVGKYSALLLQKIGIAKEMLYILHSSTLENLRLNGESCVEKIRLVGAAMLELIDQYPDSPLANTARQYGDLYPYILACLESKASESLVEST